MGLGLWDLEEHVDCFLFYFASDEKIENCGLLQLSLVIFGFLVMFVEVSSVHCLRVRYNCRMLLSIT